MYLDIYISKLSSLRIISAFTSHKRQRERMGSFGTLRGLSVETPLNLLKFIGASRTGASVDPNDIRIAIDLDVMQILIAK